MTACDIITALAADLYVCSLKRVHALLDVYVHVYSDANPI